MSRLATPAATDFGRGGSGGQAGGKGGGLERGQKFFLKVADKRGVGWAIMRCFRRFVGAKQLL